MTAAEFLSCLGQSVKSMCKVMAQSRCTTFPDIATDTDSRLIVMGNGPSLNDSLRNNPEAFGQSKLLAVNFAACTDEFMRLKPEMYVLADPHFFSGEENPNIKKLHRALQSVDWPMTLYIPTGGKSVIPDNINLTIRKYNAVGIEGFRWLRNMLYGMRLGMPRPRNVLIPSLMIALWSGFKEIYITGADHSWMSTLAVTDDNVVVSVQPHFYEDSEEERNRVRSVYQGVRLHQVVYSFYVAFKSYFDIRDYADHKGAEIYNATPESMIDAFERRPLQDK